MSLLVDTSVWSLALRRDGAQDAPEVMALHTALLGAAAERMPAGATDVVVKTEIVQPGNRPIQLDYSVEKQDSGWKVFDVVVAGVSLVSNYRSTFNQEVSANGVDGLLKMLVEKNKQNNPGAK